MKNVDDCFLCLKRSRDPLVCMQGHLSCKECIYENILAQKDEIARQRDTSNVNALVCVNSDSPSQDFVKSEDGIGIPLKSSMYNSKKQKLSSYWVPSLAPEGKTAKQSRKSVVVCPYGEHEISLKLLAKVNFFYRQETLCCPVCSEEIHKGAHMIGFKECGHVVCQSCVAADCKTCPVCQIDCSQLILLKGDGTGYSSAGNAAVKKFDIAFQ